VFDSSGPRTLPVSPCLAWVVFLYTAPCPPGPSARPPAIPHASKTGAIPGALQGVYK
jgi:hypothetical protein